MSQAQAVPAMPMPALPVPKLPAKTMPVLMPAQSLSMDYSTAEAISVPWPIWAAVGGIAASLVGVNWDYTWHMSIGLENFATPPHLLIGFGGVLVGLIGAIQIAITTLTGAAEERETSMRVLGLYGPAGAFIALWGTLAMLASAPFDNWWHNAYGLDVQFITPPHGLLFLGHLATKFGAMAWMASIFNRSGKALQGRLAWLLLFAGSTCISSISNKILPLTSRADMHSAGCYLVVALFIPTMLIATGWGSVHRWGCTIAAAFYMGIGMVSEWLIPLFPAQPRLGPVYHNVTHLIPLQFPLLLIVPAVVTDLLLQRMDRRPSWLKALWVGPAFMLSFIAVQWPFASFLMSPASRNAIFGTGYFAYSDPAGILYDPYKFRVVEQSFGMFLLVMAVALAVSIATTRLGLGWGDWMRRVRR